MKIYGLDVQDALYQKPELCSQQQQINLTLLDMIFLQFLPKKTIVLMSAKAPSFT